MTTKLTTPSRKQGIVAFEENPFWDDTKIQVGTKRISVSGGMHISNEGESVSHSGIHVVREVDETEFMKIYTKNIKSIFDLKPSTQRVLQYLLVELQKTPNADAIYLAWLDADRYFSELDVNISRSSFQRALKELLTKGFLAESTRVSMFWFNPNLFFNGNRMTFINEFRKKKKIEGDAHLQKDAFDDR
ncbi:MAG: hypothetical protein HRU18_28690 [Pseudoalteromonas sp.]|uniref:hypothetical protein n=1 Tax=Pseudoalteromonas sp. TaxID=53249 RepID=UPI001D2864D5|nr:hypothetical protein [Pseudoalteromonas sp.]NRA82189.1 hypothetical protein [Pseudoalteromonas sp.]